MKLELNHSHRWDVSPREAVGIQHELARHVRFEPLAEPPETIAGIDVSFHRRGYKQYDARCAIAVVTLPELDVVERVVHEEAITFPYVPGLLSFREIPSVIKALERLTVRPDVYMADGQGYAHPRRLGLASHLGVLLERPVLGVAKSRLIGTYIEPPVERGGAEVLLHQDELIGMVVRTRTGVKPVYVSVGHRITLEEAVGLTLACAPKYRIPEPTRQAHQLSRS